MRPAIAEYSEVEFEDDIEPTVRLSLINHCSTSFDFCETCQICEEEIMEGRVSFYLSSWLAFEIKFSKSFFYKNKSIS